MDDPHNLPVTDLRPCDPAKPLPGILSMQMMHLGKEFDDWFEVHTRQPGHWLNRDHLSKYAREILSHTVTEKIAESNRPGLQGIWWLWSVRAPAFRKLWFRQYLSAPPVENPTIRQLCVELEEPLVRLVPSPLANVLLREKFEFNIKAVGLREERDRILAGIQDALLELRGL